MVLRRHGVFIGFVLLVIGTSAAVYLVQKRAVHRVENRVKVVERSACSGLTARVCVSRLLASLSDHDLRVLGNRLRADEPQDIRRALIREIRREIQVRRQIVRTPAPPPRTTTVVRVPEPPPPAHVPPPPHPPPPHPPQTVAVTVTVPRPPAVTTPTIPNVPQIPQITVPIPTIPPLKLPDPLLPHIPGLPDIPGIIGTPSKPPR